MVKEYYIKPFSLFNVNGKDNWYILHNDGLNDKVETITALNETEARIKYSELVDVNVKAKILCHDSKVEARDGDVEQIKVCIEQVKEN